VLASAPLNRSLSASFMRLPANCAHPERRASEIRLAIARVCQAAAAETTILTEQTEFTDRHQPPPTIAQQIFLRLDFSATGPPQSRGSEAAALCRSAEDRRPGRATGVARLRALFHLHVGAGREILVGEVVVVTASVVPISQDTVAGHGLARTPAGRILTASRWICMCGTCGQSQTSQPEAAGHRHRRSAPCD
jgi:hypothetical protein